MEMIRGLISRIIKRTDDRIFAAVSYEKDNVLSTAKISGRAYDTLEEGDVFLAKGRWRESEYRGRKESILNFMHIRPCTPTHVKLIEAHLISLFNESQHGISEKAIRDLVSRHGDNTLHAIDENPSLLLELTSNRDRFQQDILEMHRRRSSGRRASTLLTDAGLNEKQVGKILSAFKDDTLEVLTNDPYDAARVPDAGGFPTADRVGVKMGVSKNDRRRINAGVEHLIRMAMDNGSTCIPLSDALWRLKDKIGITVDDIKHFVATLNESEPYLSFNVMNDNVYAALGSVSRNEGKIAQRVTEMLTRPSRSESEINAVAEKVFSSSGMKFDAVQKKAVIEAARHSVFILTGGPGTGKTTVMRAVADVCAALGDGPIWLAAPTGQASRRLEEVSGRPTQTGHRLLKAQPNDRNGGSYFRINHQNQLPDNSVVIFDESSMSDVELASGILEALPDDGRIIFVGDRNQLPSVGPGKVLSDLLKAKHEDRYIIPSVELTRVYRQGANSKIAHDAFLIRDGITPQADEDSEGGVAFVETDPRRITNRIESLMTEVFSQKVYLDGEDNPPVSLNLMTDVVVLCPQAPGPGGTHEINNALSKLLNPNGQEIPGVQHGAGEDKRIPLPRVGDRVMLTGENDPENNLSNGDTGQIIGLEHKEGAKGGPNFIKVQFNNNKEVLYPASHWRKLILAYAMTIHKSQGSQYPVVLMPMTMAHERMLDRTLLYTGWTRAEKLVALIGEKEALHQSVDSQSLTDRLTQMKFFVEKAYIDKGLTAKGPYVSNHAFLKENQKRSLEMESKCDAIIQKDKVVPSVKGRAMSPFSINDNTESLFANVNPKEESVSRITKKNFSGDKNKQDNDKGMKSSEKISGEKKDKPSYSPFALSPFG